MFTLLKMVQLNFEMWFPLKIKVALHSLSLSSCFHLSSNFRFFSLLSSPHVHPLPIPPYPMLIPSTSPLPPIPPICPSPPCPTNPFPPLTSTCMWKRLLHLKKWHHLKNSMTRMLNDRQTVSSSVISITSHEWKLIKSVWAIAHVCVGCCSCFFVCQMC